MARIYYSTTWGPTLAPTWAAMTARVEAAKASRAQLAAASAAAQQKAEAQAFADQLAAAGRALVRLAAKAKKAAKAAARVEAAKVSKAAKASAKAAKVARVVGAKASAARVAAYKAVKAAPGAKSRAAAKKVLAGLPTAVQAYDAAFLLASAGRKLAPTPKAPKGQGRRKARLAKAAAKAVVVAQAIASVFGRALRKAQAAGLKALAKLLKRFGPGAADALEPLEPSTDGLVLKARAVRANPASQAWDGAAIVVEAIDVTEVEPSSNSPMPSAEAVQANATAGLAAAVQGTDSPNKEGTVPGNTNTNPKLDELVQLLASGETVDGFKAAFLGTAWAENFFGGSFGYTKGKTRIELDEFGAVLVNGNSLREHMVVFLSDENAKEGQEAERTLLRSGVSHERALVAFVVKHGNVALLDELSYIPTQGPVTLSLAQASERGRAAVVGISVRQDRWTGEEIITAFKGSSDHRVSAAAALCGVGIPAICNATFGAVHVGEGAVAVGFTFSALDAALCVLGFQVDKAYKALNRLKLQAKSTCAMAVLENSASLRVMPNGEMLSLRGALVQFVYADSAILRCMQGMAPVAEYSLPPVELETALTVKLRVNRDSYNKDEVLARVVIADAPEFSVGETVATVSGVNDLVFTGPANTRLTEVTAFVGESELSLGFVSVGVRGIAIDDSKRQKLSAPGLKASVSENKSYAAAFRGKAVSPRTVLLSSETVKGRQFIFEAACEWAMAQPEFKDELAYRAFTGTYSHLNLELIAAYIKAMSGWVTITGKVHPKAAELLRHVKDEALVFTPLPTGEYLVESTVWGFTGEVVAAVEYSPTASGVNTSYMMPAVLGVLEQVKPHLAAGFYNANEAKARRQAHKGFAAMMACQPVENAVLVSNHSNWLSPEAVEALQARRAELNLDGLRLPQPIELLKVMAKAYPAGIATRQVLAGRGAEERLCYIDFKAVSALGGLAQGDEVSGFAEHVLTMVSVACLRALGATENDIAQVYGDEPVAIVNEALNKYGPALEEATKLRRFKTHIVGARGYGRKVDSCLNVPLWEVHINPNDEQVLGTKVDEHGDVVEGPLKAGEVVLLQRAPMFTLVPFEVVLNASVPLGVARINSLCLVFANEGDADGDGITLFPAPSNRSGQNRKAFMDGMWSLHDSHTCSWKGYFLSRGLAADLASPFTPYAKDVLRASGDSKMGLFPLLRAINSGAALRRFASTAEGELSTLEAAMYGCNEGALQAQFSVDEIVGMQAMACNHLNRGVALTYAVAMVSSHLASLYSAAGNDVYALIYQSVTEWLMRVVYEGHGLGGGYAEAARLRGWLEAIRDGKFTDGVTEEWVELLEYVPPAVLETLPLILEVVNVTSFVERGRNGKTDGACLVLAQRRIVGLPLTVGELALVSSVIRRGGSHGLVSVDARADFVATGKLFPVEALAGVAESGPTTVGCSKTVVELRELLGSTTVIAQQFAATVGFQMNLAKLLRSSGRSVYMAADKAAAFTAGAKGLEFGEEFTFHFRASFSEKRGFNCIDGGRVSSNGAFLQAPAFAVNHSVEFVHTTATGEAFQVTSDMFDVNITLTDAIRAEVKAAVAVGGVFTVKAVITAAPNPDGEFLRKRKLKVFAKVV